MKAPPKPTSRSQQASSWGAIRGAMIDETYAVFAGWDFAKSKSENLKDLRESNPIGARTNSALRAISAILSRRFDPAHRDRPLVLLAKSGCDIEEWKPLLLWHLTGDEFLVRDFLLHCLFASYELGVFRMRVEDVESYIRKATSRPGVVTQPWSNKTIRRAAGGLLKIAADFGLLRARTYEFTSYHLPERSFLYILHALRDAKQSPGKVVEALEWRMFMMRPSDVEQELLRLHQFRKLEYQVAGSLIELSLPCKTSGDYAIRMVA